MKIPDKAYDVDLNVYNGWDCEVSFLPRKNSTEDSLQNLRLPKWLGEAIKVEVDFAFKKGVRSNQEELKKVMGFK